MSVKKRAAIWIVALIAFFSAQLCIIFAILLITDAVPLGSGQTQAVVYDPGNLPQPAGSTGQELWRYGPLGWDEPTSPVLGQGVAYVFTGDALLALDAETGELRWQVRDEVLVVANSAGTKCWVIDGSNADEMPCPEFLVQSLRLCMERQGKEEQAAAERELDAFPIFDSVDRHDLFYCYGTEPEEHAWYGSGREFGDWSVSEDIVYVIIGDRHSHKSFIHALDGQTGHRLWKFPGSEFLLAGDTLFVEFSRQDRDRRTPTPMLAALDPATGRVQWEAERDDEADDIRLVSGGTVYMTDGDGLFAFDAASGGKKWQAELDNFNPVTDAIVATPDTVYVQMTRGGAIDSILAIDAAGGHQRWQFDTESCLWSIGAGSESVYAVTLREELCALDVQTGEKKWCFSESMYLSRLRIVGSWEIDRWESATDRDEPFGDLVVVEDSIYISHGAGLYRLDAQTGAKRWSFGLYQSEVTPVMYGETLLLSEPAGSGSGNLVVAVDARNGQELWRFPVHSRVDRLLVDDGVLFVVTPGSIHAVNLATGGPGWQTSLDGDIVATSEAVDGVICVASGEYVHCVR